MEFKKNIFKSLITLLSLVIIPSIFAIGQGESTQSIESGNTVTIQNDSYEHSYSQSPQRAVTLTQTETEKMLALGLEEFMVGTAYLDDAILPEFAQAYESIPVLAKQYPSSEILLDAEPDFVYGGFASAFKSESGLPTRDDLNDMGINSYLCPTYGVNTNYVESQWKAEHLYQELRDIAQIFRVEERGEALISDIESRIVEATKDIDSTSPQSVLWFDSYVADGVYVGGSTGVANEIITLSGGVNVYSDLNSNWSTVSLESIIDQDPDWIVLIHAEWDTAESKLEKLLNDPIYSGMRAVQEQKFVVIDFSATTPGVRFPIAIETLAGVLK